MGGGGGRVPELRRWPTRVSMTLCDWQIRQTHVLCGCTTFGTELKLGAKLIRSLRPL